MKTILLLFLLASPFTPLTSSAAPLPPFPRAARPPLLGRAALPRRAPTSRTVTTSGPSYLISSTHTLDVDFFGCTGVEGCQKWDFTHLSIWHAPEVNTTLEAASVLTPLDWVFLATFPPSMDEIAWYETVADRHEQWFFRLADYPLQPPTAARSIKSTPSMKSNPLLHGLTTWKRETPPSPPGRRPKTVPAH